MTKETPNILGKNILNFATLMAENVSVASPQRVSVPKNHKLADWMYERLLKVINDFEVDMPDDMQAGGKFVAFHDDVLSIDDIGYRNPDIVIFYGTLSDGSKAQLVQHSSQLNLLLVAVPRQDTSTPRRKIGFGQGSREEK